MPCRGRKIVEFVRRMASNLVVLDPMESVTDGSGNVWIGVVAFHVMAFEFDPMACGRSR